MILSDPDLKYRAISLQQQSFFFFTATIGIDAAAKFADISRTLCVSELFGPVAMLSIQIDNSCTHRPKDRATEMAMLRRGPPLTGDREGQMWGVCKNRNFLQYLAFSGK